MKTLGDQAKEFRLAKGWNTTQMGKAVGTSRQNIESLEEAGNRIPKYLADLAGVLGTTADAMLITAGLSSATHSARESIAEYRIGPTLQPVLSWEHEDDLPPGDFVMIPRLNVHLSAGGGRDQVEIELAENTPLAFRSDWVRKMRLKPKKLAAMTAAGRSMEPTIWDGDSLVIDTGQQEVNDGQVYALWYDGGERVKRLYRMPGGGLRIKSDNPEHGLIELGPDYAGHVRIIGRVVHRSGSGGL